MKWVVGTGRCGMHNYTALHGGFIQSSQAWKEAGVARHHGKPFDRNLIESVIAERMTLPFPFVTDCSQFMFMDIIASVDKEAGFIWLIGDKESVVRGFMEKGAEQHRIHPLGWDFAYKNKRRLLEWYYDEVNAIISKYLLETGVAYETVKSSELPMAPIDAIEALRQYA